MSRARYARLVEALPAVVPFVPPEALERRIGRTLAVRIGANESAFGPSPKALEAMRRAAAQASWYGDPESHELRHALGGRLGVAPGNIVVGAGIDDLLGLVVRAFIDPGDAVVMSKGAYPTFAFHVNGYGGRLVTPPYRDFRNDLEALADAARAEKAKLVFLANPDNPTGSWAPSGEIRRLVEALPEGAVLLLDEAYSEFAPAAAIPPLEPEHPRLIRTRTFSKAHGMAGARIGYAVAPAETIRSFDKIRHHFGVNRIAQEGALASLGDPAFIASVVEKVEAGRRDIAAIAAGFGLAAHPSATNFVAVDMGSGERARALLQRLLEDEAVFLRMPGVAPLDRTVRVTVGTEDERARFAAALERVLKKL
jgi:histidinol-phosphate aminotransferase